MTQKRRAGFELRYIDWLMCHSYSEIVGALIGELSGVALLLIIGRAFVYSAPTSQSLSIGILATRAVVLGAITSPFALAAWWTVRTWKQLWRYGRSPWERAVYDYGVRFIGIFTAVSQFFILTWLGWISDSGALFGPPMMGGAIAALFFGIPVSLHFGYFMGRTLAAIAGAERDPRVEVGDPPHVSQTAIDSDAKLRRA
jgi:hypothetical protein